MTKSNWGRWGDDDERGAANFATPEVLLSALASVRRGIVVALSDEIRKDRVPVAPARTPATHLMSLDGGDFAAGYHIHDSSHGVADDYLFMACQGTTHVDALGHLWYDESLYNGFAATTVRSYGATRLGIENLGHLVTRGVFLDIAGHLGVTHLADTHTISPEELISCADAAGVTVRTGDVVLIRTGWRTVFDSDPHRYASTAPGIGIEAARWLAEQQVAAVGSDNLAVEVQTAHDRFEGGSVAPECHKLLIRDCGTYLIELLNLEDLASHKTAEFLFVAAPLKILGGSGSPLNPLAIL
ncbi:cyclase family protein [Mycolicibacterium rhodesiae JS60]|nr:cyclase family protein [Mycolicibacterium rhodesiae JS60]